MTMDEAAAILKDWVKPDGELYSLSPYVSWSPRDENKGITLDDDRFTADQLEALAVYMRHYVEE